MLQIIKELKLEEILNQHLLEKEVKVTLTLAQNRVIRPLSLYHIASWNEGTILSKLYGDLPLSSQSPSNLLNKMGESDLPIEFSRRLIKRVSTSTTLIYDITSLSSYSTLINLLEYGYNRDGLNVPQVNLSVIVDKNLGIPVMYDLYPGSIVDVSTLKNTIRKIEALGIKEATLVMDRDFFSISNLEELLSNGLSFILPAPLTVKAVKQLLSSIHSEIEDANLLKMYNGEPIFVKPVTLEIVELSIQGYSFYSQKRESTLKGSLFISFLALIIQMRLLKLMHKTELIEKYTVGGLLLELEKLKKIELSNGETITSELTKKQKEILDKLNLCA